MGRLRGSWLIAAALLVAGGLQGCGDAESASRPAHGVALEIVVPDGDLEGTIHTDSRAIAGLQGHLVPSESAVRAAACHNIENWLDDHTLVTDTVVGSNPVLLRVAELVFSGEVDAELARLAEQQRWREGADIELDSNMANAGFDQADLDEYLWLVAQPPRDAANDTYVVYAASSKMSTFLVVYAEAAELSTGRTSNGRYPDVSAWIAGNGELTEFTFPQDDCKDEN